MQEALHTTHCHLNTYIYNGINCCCKVNYAIIDMCGSLGSVGRTLTSRFGFILKLVCKLSTYNQKSKMLSSAYINRVMTGSNCWTITPVTVHEPLNSRLRLRLLLYCYTKARHCNSGRQRYWSIIHQLGKGYSSCIAGDGPPSPITLANGLRVFAGLKVYVNWSSFPESKEEVWGANQQ